MKKVRLFAAMLPLLALPVFSSAQYDSQLTERLNLFGPFQFQNKTFHLVRTSYSADSTTYNTYTQEYIDSGAVVDSFKNLLIICVFTGPNMSLEDIANAKIDELRELKKMNSIVNWQTFNNKKTGEFMLDFVTSENSSDGQYIDTAARSVYRYMMVTDKSGQECGVLFGATVRAFGDEVDPFMATLTTKTKVDLVRNVGLFKIPEITIAKQ